MAGTYTNSREAPLHKATETLLSKVDDLMNFLQRDRKHTLGQQMLNIVLGMLECSALAYDFPKERVGLLKKYLCLHNNLSSILKMCEKKGYLIHKGKNMYVDMIEPLGITRSQALGWLKGTTSQSRQTEMPSARLE